MDINPNNPSSWPSMPTNDQNSGAPKPPPPPPPEITLRTMKSDLESIKQTGGSNPTPKPFTPSEFKSIPVTPPPPPTINPNPINFGQVPEQKKVSTATFSADKELSAIAADTETIAAPSVQKKKIIGLIGGLIAVAVIFAVLGYKFVFPFFMSNQTETPTTQTNNAPVTETTPVVTTTQEETAQAPIHQSQLSLPDGVYPVQLSLVDALSINAAINQQSDNVVTGTLSEVTLSDTKGQIAASKFLHLFIPEMSNDLLAFFEEDFTATIYKDANGVWPAYVFKLKTDPAASGAQNFINNTIETSANLQSFFLSNPGTVAQGFKSGNISGNATRYLPYPNAGASLNLAWIQNRLIISTSFNGLKKLIIGLK